MTGIASKSRHTVKCPDLPSAIRPVPHSKELPVIKPPENPTFSDDNSDFIAESTKETMLIAIRHIKQVVPYLNPTY